MTSDRTPYMKSPNYYYGKPIDSSKNNEKYAKDQVKNGIEHTTIDHVSTKYYYGRTFSVDGTITQWMRPTENEPMLTEPKWNEELKRWTM